MSPAADDDAWSRLLRARTHAGAGCLDDVSDPLVELYRPLALAGPRHVAAQLGQSIDGFIASRTGHGEGVTGAEDHVHLHRLRALVDAVVVGVGTALADDPRLTVRHVPGPQPARVVLDPRGRAPRDLTVFTDGAARTLWVVGAGAGAGIDAVQPPDGVELLRLPCGDGGFDEACLVDALADQGLGRLLVEGGGVTVSRFLAAGVLDRLYVTVTPMLLGDGRPGLRFRGPERLEHALRPATRCFPLGSDVLFELTLRPPAPVR
ncbi:MAG TPA: RibD family protein [Jiangellales bacterium]|nr:RibD family protein [Jiangellales bacterium]